MTTKQKSTTKAKAPTWTHKGIRAELERSIVLMVLSLPSVEHEVIANFLDRKGFVVQEVAESDRKLQREYGIAPPDKKRLAERAATKAKAEKLYKRAKVEG